MASHGNSDDDSDSETLPYREIRLRTFKRRKVGGRQNAQDAHGRVWPPTILGRRKDAFTDPYIHSDAPKITLPGLEYAPNTSVMSLKEITIGSIKNDQCPLYVFPPRLEGHMWAVFIEQFGGMLMVRRWIPLNIGWTLKYATVKDMLEIDPHRKLVDWNAVSSLPPGSATSKDPSNDTISMLGTPQFLSALQSEEFQGQLRAIRDGQISLQKCVEDNMGDAKFASELKSILFQNSPGATVKSVLKDVDTRISFMREAFEFDGARVATASFERLSSLGMDLREHGGNMFISRMIDRGTELELKALQSTAEEIGRATINKRKLAQLQLDHLESTRNLVEKQKKEMIQHLWGWMTKFQIIMEEEMLSRAKLIKSIQQAEQTISAIQKFISAGATEIAEEVYTDALKEIRDQEHGSNSTKHREAVTNQECCICYSELEGFPISSGHDKSSSSKKLQKRACFLPCMHANVCTTCSEKRWKEGPKKCPVCRQQLTEEPRAIYL